LFSLILCHLTDGNLVFSNISEISFDFSVWINSISTIES